MYAQIFLVTSVRGAFLTPQIFAKASDRVFGAKMPLPDFFIAAAERFLRCLDGRLRRLRDRRLLGLGRRDRRLLSRLGRHSDRRMQMHTSLE